MCRGCPDENREIDVAIQIEIPEEIRELEKRNQWWYSDNMPDASYEERREAEYADAAKVKRQIRPYCYWRGYSDCNPFEVVKIVSDNCVEIRPMKAKPCPKWKEKMEWHAGGFAGHLANQWDQEWILEPDEDAPVERIRWHKAKGRWGQGRYMAYVMCDKPYKFYDYNF